MPGSKSAVGSKAVGTWPTPEHSRLGTLTKSRNQYVLKVGRRTLNITASAILPAKDLDALVGQEVLVAFSPKRKTNVVAISKWPPIHPRCYWIICYLPVPDIVKRIQPKLRTDLLAQMQKAGIVSARLAAELRSGFGAGR